MRTLKMARIVATIIAMAYGCAAGFAVPAYPGAITVTNPDGTTMTIHLHGDEWFNYTTTDDGCLIEKCADGYFHYAIVEQGAVKATEFIYNGDASARPAVVASFNQATMIKELIANSNTKAPTTVAPSTGPELSVYDGTVEKATNCPTIGKVKFPVILVQFPDKPFDFAYDQFNDWLSKEGYDYNQYPYGSAVGSITDYFKHASNGQFDPQFDLFGPVTASHNHDYYGYGNNNKNMGVVADLAVEVCQALSEAGTIDFSNYDNDNDQIIDIVYLVFAGAGAADSDDQATNIWPHKWWVYGGSYKQNLEDHNYIWLNNKLLYLYGCSPEYSYGKLFTTIGTFCHEFGHALGLMDHYDTQYNDDTRNPGKWDIMAGGSYNMNGNVPPTFNAYERSVMGWITPKILKDRGDYTLNSISDYSNDYYNDSWFIPASEKNPNEYYILENRQKKGWDSYLPHHGMLIWHINYDEDTWNDNTINVKPVQNIDIIEAGGVDNDDETYTPFPGNGNNTVFAADTNPAFKPYNGDDMAAISSITEYNDGVITFKYKGGFATESSLKLGTPQTETDKAVLTWEPLDGVSKYYVTVTTDYAVDDDADTASKPQKSEVITDTLVDEEEVTGTSYTVTGLTADTKYDYVIGHYDGYDWKEATGTFTTATETVPFAQLKPQNVHTTETGDTYFIAEWDPVEGATSYTVNVYTATAGEQESETATFVGKKLPTGWTSTASSYSTVSGFYGNASPALLMDAGDELLTKVYDKEVVGVNIGSVRRWLDTDGKFTVQGRTSADSDDWTYILYQINAYDRKTGGGVNPMPNPFGCHQVRITQLSDGAQSIIDDVTIYMAADTTYTPVEGKTNLNAGDATTLRVQGLEYDTTYYYTVTAHSDTESSLESDYVKVTTDVFTGVDNVAADNATTVSVDQLTATVTAGNDTTVAIYTPSGVTVVAPEQLAAGTTATYQLPATGIYLVKVGRTTYKISAK